MSLNPLTVLKPPNAKLFSSTGVSGAGRAGSGQLEYQLSEGHRLVVEEADREFSEHIAIEQTEEGERLIVKVTTR